MAKKGSKFRPIIIILKRKTFREIYDTSTERTVQMPAALGFEFSEQNFPGVFYRVIRFKSNCSNPQLYL